MCEISSVLAINYRAVIRLMLDTDSREYGDAKSYIKNIYRRGFSCTYECNVLSSQAVMVEVACGRTDLIGLLYFMAMEFEIEATLTNARVPEKDKLKHRIGFIFRYLLIIRSLSKVNSAFIHPTIRELSGISEDQLPTIDIYSRRLSLWMEKVQNDSKNGYLITFDQGEIAKTMSQDEVVETQGRDEEDTLR